MKKLNSALQYGSALLVLAASGAMTRQAQAQVTPERGLEEIVVTAQRRSEILEDVPMSISVVTAAALEASGVTNIHDIGQLASAVQINWAGGYTQPSIRGVTSLTNGSGAENNVAIYVDGFYEPNTVAINQDLANIESIQVLKGPQGALYGRNATGGAILINTLEPSDTFTGLAEVTYARFDDRRVKAYLSGPLDDMFSFSIAGYYRESDGYIDFADPAVFAPNPNSPAIPKAEHAAPVEQRSVRTKLQADFSENFSATLGYNYGYSDVFYGLLFTTYAHRPATLPAAPRFPQVAYNYGTTQLAKTDQGTLKLVWTTDIGTLTSYSGYSQFDQPGAFDFDGTYADLTYSTSKFVEDTKQQTVDFAITAVENLELVVGASYINDDIHSDADTPTINYGPGKTVSTVTRHGTEADSYAVYADGTYHLTDTLSLSAGARYTDEKKTSFYGQFNVAQNRFTFAPTTKEISFSKMTPRASIRYELAPQTNVYASYSKGFRSGAFALSGAATPGLWLPLDPEVIDAYELGFKTAQGVFRFDIAGFYYDYTDIHVSVTVPDPRCTTPTGCTVLTVFQNAKGAEIYGVDGNITVSPVEKLNIHAGAAWLHARYTDFPNATGTGLNTVTNLNVGAQVQDWSDKEMARAPQFSGNLGADYEMQMPYGNLRLGANVRYSDSYVINNPSLFGLQSGTSPNIQPGRGEQRYRQDSLTLVNATVTWTDPNDRFSMGVFGNNLTDKQYFVVASGGANGDYGAMQEPRTYGVRAGYKF